MADPLDHRTAIINTAIELIGEITDGKQAFSLEISPSNQADRGSVTKLTLVVAMSDGKTSKRYAVNTGCQKPLMLCIVMYYYLVRVIKIVEMKEKGEDDMIDSFNKYMEEKVDGPIKKYCSTKKASTVASSLQRGLSSVLTGGAASIWSV